MAWLVVGIWIFLALIGACVVWPLFKRRVTHKPKQRTVVADPTLPQDTATKSYVDGVG